MKPAVVISLDFELYWGVADVLGDDPGAYRPNLEGELDAVYGMLDYFGRERIHATWATVGALACSGWDEYLARAPAPPAYHDPKLRFSKTRVESDRQGRIHFAPEAVQAIAAAPGQELASHTFSHIYFSEAGCTDEDIVADSQAVASIFGERVGLTPLSFVFPRNQVSYTELLKQEGIRWWRRNPDLPYWKSMRQGDQSAVQRARRMAESLLPIGTRRAPAAELRASYLVRFALPDWAWRLHVNRIAADAKRLKEDESLHLWWHPHNMGADVDANLRRLAGLIDRVREAAPDTTRFVTMAESVSA